MGQQDQFSVFYPYSVRSFWLDTNSDTGNHELSRIPLGVDIIVRITVLSEN